MTTYRGSCHCGSIAFAVQGELESALACNCSICSRKGSLLWFVPRDQLQLDNPDAPLSTYTFNKHVIQHHFCPTCGMHPFGEGKAPDGSAMAAINIRCLEDIDLATVPVELYDGKSQ
ncbi:MAG: GFA family protein [Pseudomonadales bacterium]|nr:GFA family protein [Pseudomonadales bacterium]